MIATTEGKRAGVTILISKEIVDNNYEITTQQELNYQQKHNRESDGPRYIITSFKEKSTGMIITVEAIYGPTSSNKETFM